MSEEPKIDLNDLAADLGEVYFIAKESKSDLEDLRLQFFKGASQALEAQDLAQKTVRVPADIEDVASYVAKYHSGWRTVETTADPEGEVVAIIEKDPDLQPFTKVLRLEPWAVLEKGKKKTVYGYAITRSIRDGKLQVDDERMAAINPALHDEVTTFPDWVVTVNKFLNLKQWKQFLAEAQPKRVLRDDLSPEELEALKPYMYEGPKTAVLNVRYAKEDESE